MATIEFSGSAVGNALQSLLMSDDIIPGNGPSYQLCKTIYTFHPLGAKIAEKPITLAQSKPRKISISKGPEPVKEAYEREWKAIGADAHIFNLMRLSRVYGVSSVALLVKDKPTDAPIDLKAIHKETIAFNVFDPLNTAGSLVINQQPNDMDFLKTSGRLVVGGRAYHPSRTCVVMNEDPIYIEYTGSAFGFTGRSVYQRILFPLKSFVQSMLTDDLIAVKSGVLVAMLKQAGSIIDNAMAKLFGQKRQMIKEAKTYNVLSVGQDDKIESLNLQNLDGAFGQARTDILENIASGADDMPAILLNQETFAQGFGEGSEDAKMVGRYVDRIREKMDAPYRYFDAIVQHRAWNPEFYATVQKQFPEEYGGVPYETAFYDWCNSFAAEWPPFLDEPPSEQVKVDDVKLKAVIAMLQVLLPAVDPENRAIIIQWACDNFNELKLLFGSSLELDYDALMAYEPEEQLEEPTQSKPFADSITASDRAVANFSIAVERLLSQKPGGEKGRVRAMAGAR